ncbi:Large cysteine-rich periplasmic protein omcB precursor [compost metagenome]
MNDRSHRSGYRRSYYRRQRMLIAVFIFFVSIIFLASFAVSKDLGIRKNFPVSFKIKLQHPPDSADLVINKTVNVKSVAVGKTIIYSININNKGPADAKKVVVTDTLPNELVYSSSTVSSGNVEVDGKYISWNVGDLLKKKAESMKLTVTVVKEGNFRNTAFVRSETVDHCKCNDKSVSTIVSAKDTADVSIVKTSSKKVVNEGDTLSYLIKVSNEGPSPAKMIKVKDILPENMTFESASVAAVDYDVITRQLSWNFNVLEAGQSQFLIVKVKAVKVGIASNTAVVTADTPDPVKCNNVSTAEDVVINVKIVPKKADVSIVKSADKQYVPVSKEFEYVFLIKNAGPDTARQVVVKDTLNEKTAFYNYKTEDGLFAFDNFSNSFLWTLDELAPGKEIRISVRVIATKIGDVVNRATVESAVEDPIMANNTSTYMNKITGLRIPNVFTPNGDNVNDTFQIEGLETWSHNEISIMNRWGGNVFKKENYMNDWDGSQLQPGTYYYVLTVKNETTDQQSFTGWVAILKK